MIKQASRTQALERVLHRAFGELDSIRDREAALEQRERAVRAAELRREAQVRALTRQQRQMEQRRSWAGRGTRAARGWVRLSPSGAVLFGALLERGTATEARLRADAGVSGPTVRTQLALLVQAGLATRFRKSVGEHIGEIGRWNWRPTGRALAGDCEHGQERR